MPARATVPPNDDNPLQTEVVGGGQGSRHPIRRTCLHRPDTNPPHVRGCGRVQGAGGTEGEGVLAVHTVHNGAHGGLHCHGGRIWMYGGPAGGLHASHSSGRARAKVEVGSWAAPTGGWGCFSFPTAKSVFARMALHIPSSAHVPLKSKWYGVATPVLCTCTGHPCDFTLSCISLIHCPGGILELAAARHGAPLGRPLMYQTSEWGQRKGTTSNRDAQPRTPASCPRPPHPTPPLATLVDPARNSYALPALSTPMGSRPATPETWVPVGTAP